MNPETKIPLRVFLIILIGTIVVVCAASLNQPIKVQRVEVEVPKILSQRELQEFLVSEGYDIGEKGIDGKAGTDTRKAWDKYICDQYATAEFKRAEK